MVTSASVAGAAGFIPAATLALLRLQSLLGVTLNQSHPLGRVEQGRESRRHFAMGLEQSPYAG